MSVVGEQIWGRDWALGYASIWAQVEEEPARQTMKKAGSQILCPLPTFLLALWESVMCPALWMCAGDFVSVCVSVCAPASEGEWLWEVGIRKESEQLSPRASKEQSGCPRSKLAEATARYSSKHPFPTVPWTTGHSGETQAELTRSRKWAATLVSTPGLLGLLCSTTCAIIEIPSTETAGLGWV